MQNHQFDRSNLNAFTRWWLDIDKVNVVIVFTIIIFGLIMTATSSTAIAKRINVDKFFFLNKQIIFAIIAMILLVAISFIEQEYIKIISIFGLAITILLLIAVLIFGLEAKGAKRWISLAGFTLQPSEFAKTFFIIVNAHILQKYDASKPLIKYGTSCSLYFLIIGLLILQPDIGMTITLTAMWISQLFVYGIPMPIIFVAFFLAITGSVFAYVLLPHVEDRINKFLDSDGKNYQVERSIDAFVNGSFFGKGTGNGVVKKFIPDSHTDFIFAVIGEEYGILTCALIIALFAYLITRIVKRALDEENMFVYLSLFGLMMQFTIQVIINICVNLKLLPAKGMTLPFISYGGSSMISMAICFGLILAFTKKKYHPNVDYGNLKLI